MKIFLTAKHWHLFLLFFAIPMLIHGYFMSTFFISMTSMASDGTMAQPENPFAFFSFLIYDFAAIFILVLGTLLGWLYSVATSLQAKLPEGAKMNVTLFKVFLFIPPIYIICLLTGIFWLVSNIAAGNMENPQAFIGMIFIVIPLHFFCIFCMLYSFWFVSKSLKMVETQKADLSFSDYAGEFFLIWFFFIGVWIIQPRINKLFEEPEPTS